MSRALSPAAVPVDPRSAVWTLSEDLLAVLGDDACLRAVNPAWTTCLGRAPDELIGRPLASLAHPDDRDTCTLALTTAGRNGNGDGTPTRRFSLRLEQSDGGYRAVAFSAVATGTTWTAVGRVPEPLDTGSRAAGFDAVSREIAVLDGSGRILATNAAWRRLGAANGADRRKTGVGADYLAACDCTDDPVAGSVAAGLRSVLDGERDSLALEYPCQTPDAERWFEMRATRCVHDGAVRCLVEHEDITVRRTAQSTAQMRSRLLDEVAAAVVGTDRAFRITEWNRGAQALYGWTRAEAVGREVRELLVPDIERERAGETAEELATSTGEWAGEASLRRRDGTVFPAHVAMARVGRADGTTDGYVTVSIDDTERLHAAQELRSAQQYLAAVTGGMAEGLATHDDEGRLVYMNAAAETILGWRFEELEGRVVHPITHGRRPDGSPFPVEECPIQQAARCGEAVRVDGLLRPRGRDAAPRAVHGLAVRDARRRQGLGRRVQRHHPTQGRARPPGARS